ncbi:hypothetical protein BDZ45DRAFT_74428 [Acephala macrosclerotiorum]|nr:hypothetical protein BDZ45DRAFT_74428 [Acephala macrosclerotiorum]
MARSVYSPNCDMNDPWTLSCYSQMIIFQNDSSRLHFVFEDPSHTQQQVIQSLAHRVGLEYEYNLLTRRAVVSRPSFLPHATIPDPFWDQYNVVPEAMDSLDLALQNLHTEPVQATSHPGFEAATAEPISREENVISGFGFDPSRYSMLMEGLERTESRADVPAQASGHTKSSMHDHLAHEQKVQQHNSPSDLKIDTPQNEHSQTLVANSGFYAAHANLNAELASPHEQTFKTNLGTPQSNLFYTISTSDLLQYTYKPQSRVTSRAGSISSVQSNQGRGRVGKMFSRVSSSRSIEGSMYSCFDSKSTDTSISSRRSRQAMDKFAKAAMKAVKAIGACWRCKLLRKQCDDENPCESCPTSTKKSEWKLLGCKRGTLEENMPPVVLCTQLLVNQTDYHGLSKDCDAAVEANRQSRLRAQRREVVMQDERGAALIGTLDSFLQAVDNTLSDGDCTPFALSTGNQCAIKLKPLDECVKNIIWELSESDALLPVLGGFTIDSLTVLLRSASLYQAKTEGDQLIAQSLICLKDSLEAVNIKTSLEGFHHSFCRQWDESTAVAAGCYITPIASLEASMSGYIGELSRVLFQKEKMRKVRTWWLSVFYSLCIQNFVRQVLLQFQGCMEPENRSIGAQQYLHLAVRLFLAYSRKYNPLNQKSQKEFGATMSHDDALFESEIAVARMAVAYDSWKSVGIKSSKDYLNLLFEDEGHTLQPRDKLSLGAMRSSSI